jgi:CheY-like chemotaxis protein
MQPEAKAITVLCVDDEQTGLSPILQAAGYRVLVAKSGSEGMKLFSSEPVDAVVLDYWMNDMTGLEVARAIRRQNRSVPIIIHSAYIELLDESLGLVDVWIRKGEQNPKYLLGRLAQLLRSQKSEGRI